ncbi:SAM-dependent methyltransferase [Paracoccus sp. Ld10]|uniref:SAM-dependent methyltransferase n=1 Tax=Paracoccus sp. Ld10 TaxID=649158 RepID=UPI00386F338E
MDHLMQLYAANDDPWNHRTSKYEAAKYAASLNALGPGPFREALEIGCGNGTLAVRLAPRCTRLTVMECIPAAAKSARRALASQPQVNVIEGVAPGDLPDLRPDLVLLSEVLYFLTPNEISVLGQWLIERTSGPVIAVNWTGSTDETLDGAEAVTLLAAVLGTPATTDHGQYRIDRFN